MKIVFLPVLVCLLIACSLKAQNLPIIPQPNKVVFNNKQFTLPQKLNIYLEGNSIKPAGILLDFLASEFDISYSFNSNDSRNSIRFLLKPHLPPEAYHLEITENGIQVAASSEKGWFYGVQSLQQLIQSGQYTHQEKISLPGVKIEDEPRFRWRAFMLDEGRYFKGMEDVKQLLDEMAYLKMNIFHWHLVDDQGWRIEIKKYPRLTEVGSKRKSTQIGPLKWNSHIQSGIPHEGFYTQNDIKEIIAYAADRHITVVPEIEMPGHSSAAIAAYPWLGTSKQNIEVPIKFGVGKDVYDIGDEKVYQFLTDVLEEIIALFPSSVIHIGGDEVRYDHWKNAASVQKYMKEKGLNTPAELQIFFTNRISHYLQGKGRRMMGWNEIMGHNVHEFQKSEDTQNQNQELAKTSVVHFWKGDISLINDAASKGYDIVNSIHSNTYLDYSY